MTEKTSVEYLPNMDKKQCNDYDISNTGREKQKFKSISDILEYVSVQEIVLEILLINLKLVIIVIVMVKEMMFVLNVILMNLKKVM